LLFPRVQHPAKFDTSSHRSIEVTISDDSTIVPGGGSPQLGFRRAGLLLGNGYDASNSGTHTSYWSVLQDHARPMILTHEYLNVWHERNNYTADQWSFNTGIMLAQDHPLDSNITTTHLAESLWKFLNVENDIIWTTPVLWDEWQNFAVRMDVNKKEVFGASEFEKQTNL
jgi:hypothetical protein